MHICIQNSSRHRLWCCICIQNSSRHRLWCCWCK